MTIGSTANQWESQIPAITEGGPEKEVSMLNSLLGDGLCLTQLLISIGW